MKAPKWQLLGGIAFVVLGLAQLTDVVGGKAGGVEVAFAVLWVAIGAWSISLYMKQRARYLRGADAKLEIEAEKANHTDDDRSDDERPAQ
jgi:hypothetical protein